MPYDLIGADELIGDELIGDDLVTGSSDVDAILGAALGLPGMRRPAPRVNAALQQRATAMRQAAMLKAAAEMQAKSGLIARQQAPTKARRLVLPMESSAAVAAGATATITARPQSVAFRPQRIVIPSTIAPDFVIVDIKVGNKSQLVQSGNLPGEAFIPTLFDGEMEMDTVQTSQDFVLQVTNISGASRTFRAAVYGRSADV